LKDPAAPEQIREVLRYRYLHSMKAPAKYVAMEKAVCEDNRLRGMFIYHGAATGRWCLAEGSLIRVKTSDGVITDKPIEEVHIDDLVWDGDNWVMHEGVVFSGEKEVISHDGVTATPEHKVYIADDKAVTLGEAREKGLLLWQGHV